MPDLTVACVFVKGYVNYTPDYVERLFNMVERNLDRDFRRVCLTDQPEAMPPGVEAIVIPTPQGIYPWWAKVWLFRRDIFSVGRLLYLDLDTLIIAPLAPIVDFDSEFALIPHAGDFNGKYGRQVVKKFNSSVMVMEAGCQSQLFDEWTYKIARSLWGDQDWIGMRSPNAATMPIEWFPRLSQLNGGTLKFMRDQGVKVVLCKKPKNHEAAQRISWVREVWK